MHLFHCDYISTSRFCCATVQSLDEHEASPCIRRNQCFRVADCEARSSHTSTIAEEDGTDNGADMLVKSDSLTHASDKIDGEETRLPTIISEREINSGVEEKA